MKNNLLERLENNKKTGTHKLERKGKEEAEEIPCKC